MAGQDYEALMADAERVLDEVDRALARLEDHSYGSCETCGAPIEERPAGRRPHGPACHRHLLLADPAG